VKTSEVLAAGRERLERNGWIQGNLSTRQGYCMIGALPPRPFAAARALVDKIVEMWPDAYPNGISCSVFNQVAEFNDEPGRTKEEVLAVFDKAILSAQEYGD
jgi:hypothetical protein